MSITFENKTFTWQEVSTSTKLPNFTAKEFFVTKESSSVQNKTKLIKQILLVKYMKIKLKSMVRII